LLSAVEYYAPRRIRAAQTSDTLDAYFAMICATKSHGTGG
jgi:hypothetical protein